MAQKTIQVEIEKVSEKTLYLKQHFGNGTLGKTKFDASFTLPSMSLLVEIGKITYKIDTKKLIQTVVEYHEKLK